MRDDPGNTIQEKRTYNPASVFLYLFCVTAVILLCIALFSRRTVERNVNVYFTNGSGGALSHTVRINFKASGIAILQKDIGGYSVDLTQEKLQDVFSTNEHIDYFTSALPAHAEVISVYPHVFETISERYISKKVPVQLRTILRLRDQFMISDSLQCFPDSIVVTGPHSIIEKTIAWSTEPVYINSRATTYKGTVILFAPEDDRVELSDIAVRYSVRVAKFARMATDLYFTHPASGDSIHVQVVYMAPTEQKDRYTASDFFISAEPDSGRARYKLKCTRYPDDIYTIRVIPSFIQ